MQDHAQRSSRTIKVLLLAVVLLLQLRAFAAFGQGLSGPIDLRSARVFAPDNLSGPEKKSIELLIDEVAKRTRIRLLITSSWPDDDRTPVIAVIPVAAVKTLAADLGQTLATEIAQLRTEGFHCRVAALRGRAPVVLVVGNDARGVLFGVGKLLRSLRMSRDRIELDASFHDTTSPALAIRGHQLGYRPKTNSYDAWDLAQWEQYIRDLAVFGCNSIELIPPRSDDAPDSPHFPLPQMEMMIGMSQLAADYGLDVWIWYPVMESRFPDSAAIGAAVKQWGEVLAKLPRVNALFVPSGDPGNVPPREFMAMLEAQAEQLNRLHPGAKIWISLQSFSQPHFDEMLQILAKEPAWLGGIVHGPQTRVSIARLRKMLPERYPVRGYPDITHSMRCEYPVPDWDLAYALTEGREVINPRPLDQATIFRLYRDTTRGVIAYSEGCNDDVNKMIWSRLCWDPYRPPRETLREYSRYFIGEKYADDFAQGLLALERNWRGPLAKNEGVTQTLERFRTMEKAADPRTRRNWRFQQALYRAYYDAYQRARLIEETEQESQAMKVLASASQFGTSKALDEAESILDRRVMADSTEALGARVKELAEALFQSIGMQLSVEKYKAISVGRGANLDELDVPLNNRIWLKNRFVELRKLDSDAARLRGIDEILHWTDPGPGGFYDDLGDPAQQPHLMRQDTYVKDPGFLDNVGVGFRSEPSWRRSWCTHIDGQYATPVLMHYPKIEPGARYKVRVVYAGENREAKVRLVACAALEVGGGEFEVHPFRAKPQPVQPVEFEIPAVATSGSTLALVWHSNPERGGPGRGCQIAEVWLIKLPKK
jgi:hypothetical protein